MTTSDISRVIVEMPTEEKVELTRLASERHDRKMGPMVRVIVREWIASEHAAEAEEASRGEAA